MEELIGFSIVCDLKVIEASNDFRKEPDAPHLLEGGGEKHQAAHVTVIHREPLQECTNSLGQKWELVEGLQLICTKGH